MTPAHNTAVACVRREPALIEARRQQTDLLRQRLTTHAFLREGRLQPLPQHVREDPRQPPAGGGARADEEEQAPEEVVVEETETEEAEVEQQKEDKKKDQR